MRVARKDVYFAVVGTAYLRQHAELVMFVDVSAAKSDAQGQVPFVQEQWQLHSCGPGSTQVIRYLIRAQYALAHGRAVHRVCTHTLCTL